MYIRTVVLTIVALALIAVSGCSSTRMNLAYNASRGEVKKIPFPVTAALIPVADTREGMMAYPKQVIVQKSYGGDKTFEINDRTMDDVFTDALTQELKALGVNLVATPGIAGTLDRDTAENVRKVLASRYPDVKVAFGAKITDFLAESQRSVVTTKVNLKAALQFYILDVNTGQLLWTDTRSDADNTVVTADRDYMVEQLNQALSSLMHKTGRDNVPLRDLLVKIPNR